MPTMAMGEVVEVNCTETLNNKKFVTTYRFDLDKKTVSFRPRFFPQTLVLPLDVLEGHLIWINKLGFERNEPTVFVYMLNRNTGKLSIAHLGGVLADYNFEGGKQQDCTRPI